MRSALAILLGAAVGVATLHPIAVAAAMVVSAALALVVRVQIALAICVVLLAGAAFGFRVDAAPPSGPAPTAHRR
jgi:hypothetical protein